MPKPSTSLEDAGRLEELRDLQLLDNPIEPEFDNLTQLASEICDAPVALISFVDQDQIWFKSRVGFDALHGPRENAFCSHAVQGTGPLVVEDAAADPRFQDNVYVQAPQGIRFYAGIPLVLSSGHAVGTLCVIDHKARTLSDKQLVSLKKLALLVTALIEAKRIALRLQDEDRNRLVIEQRLDFALQSGDTLAGLGRWDWNLTDNSASWSDGLYRIYGRDPADGVPAFDDWQETIHPDDKARLAHCIQTALAGASEYHVEFRIFTKDTGQLRYIDSRGSSVVDANGKPTNIRGFDWDITERMRATERIQELAYFDQLTGLPNRTLLADRLKQAVTASSRSGIFGALLLIDLDDFKTLNDTQGHDIGDLQLKQAAKRLSTCVREGDTAARVGGDEFVVILAGLNTNEVEAAAYTEVVAAKILAALGQPYQLGAVSHTSTASIGATLFRGQGVNMEELMKQADLAMYRAKDAGRNAVRLFDPSMEMVVLKRAALEKDLRNAVSQRQFVLHYQAQVEGAGSVIGAEVLARWHHPQRGMVSPAEFIPLAEETGVILALGYWVLETACSQLEKWARVPSMEHLTVAVNVSALQFAQADFVEQVMSVVQRAGANPQRLKLELTEGLLVGNVDDIIGKMKSLKASGIGFSLDDFGTGYSSLAYLSRLPLDQLKIDKSFVNDVVTNPDDAAIARTIIALARSLRLGVIAEGVETDAQREFLAGAGCHAYQGYIFARPLPLEDFEVLVCSISLPTTAPAM